MKTPKLIDLPEFEQDYLEPEELEPFKDIAELDNYYEDYVSYEYDLTRIIKEKK